MFIKTTLRNFTKKGVNPSFFFHITGYLVALLNRAFYSAPPAIVLHKARHWIERKACWDQNSKTPFAALCPFLFVCFRTFAPPPALQSKLFSKGSTATVYCIHRHTTSQTIQSARDENNRKADDLNKDSTNRIPKITCTDESRELCSKKGSQGFAHATAAELTWEDTSTNSTCAPYKLINC